MKILLLTVLLSGCTALTAGKSQDIDISVTAAECKTIEVRGIRGEVDDSKKIKLNR